MYNLLRICIVLIFATVHITANELEYTYYENVLSFYTPDVFGMRNVTFWIQLKQKNSTHDIPENDTTIYSIKVNIIEPKNDFWIFCIQNVKSLSGFAHDGSIYIKAGIIVRYDGYEEKFLPDKYFSVIEWSGCRKDRISTEFGTAYICMRNTLFKQDFIALNSTNWKKQVYFKTFSNEYLIFDNSDENAFLKDNQLLIQPSIVEANGQSEKCAAFQIDQCSLYQGYNYMLPLSSNFVIFRNKYTTSIMFPERIEIRAKLPKGDWVLPHILFQTCRKKRCRAMRNKCTFGSEILRANETLRRRFIEPGVMVWNRGSSYIEILKPLKNQTKNFNDDFHIYTIIVYEHTYYIAVDNVFVSRLQFLELGKFENVQYNIVFGASVGGHLGSANISTGSAAHADNDFCKETEWRRAWRGDDLLIVDYVKVQQLDPGVSIRFSY